jgi:uncharacterized membrane protein
MSNLSALAQAEKQRVAGEAEKSQPSVIEPVIEMNGVWVERSVIINSSPEKLYRFWHSFENLPRIMPHLEAVQVLSPTQSHWIAKAIAGITVEWDAEIVREQKDELIAWRSLPGSEIVHAGTVRFLRFAEAQTEVRVSIVYEPPGGQAGVLVAKLFGEEPGQQVEEDLQRFKQLMEASEETTSNESEA